MQKLLLRSAALALVLYPLLTASPVAAAKAGELCGGIAAIGCDRGLFCEYPAGKCEVADLAGKCEKSPEVCTEQFQPVCSCEGKELANDCKRKLARARKAYDGPCQKAE